MISLGNYSFGQTEEERALAAKATLVSPIARGIMPTRSTLLPILTDPRYGIIQEQKILIPLTILGGVTILSLVTFLFLRRRRRKQQNPWLEHEQERFCGYCKRPTDSISGFCSTECERHYGSCPFCGAPSLGNRLCAGCRSIQENPFKRKTSGYAYPTFEEKVLLGPTTQWQVEFETITGSCGTKTYKSYSLAKKSMDELDKRDDIKWSSLRQIA